MTKVLFVGTHGTDDPTRATFPFMEAKGAIEAGYETGIILMMEAAPLIKDRIAARVQGIGVPPLKELTKQVALYYAVVTWAHQDELLDEADEEWGGR